jgi:hypothetical protein
MRGMNMKRQALARASQPAARPTDIPLPLRGVFSESRTAQVSGLYAAGLENWYSTGLSLKTRRCVSYSSSDFAPRLRIPFEFGALKRFIEIADAGARCGDAIYDRTFGEKVDYDFISSQAVIVDGAGPPLRFDGETFVESEITTDRDVDPNTFDGVIAHNDRLFYWKSDAGALEFFFGDVGAVLGPLSHFPLNRLGNITGSILCMTSLTVDAGHGMNDTLCIHTTTGDMIVYEGLDPSDPQDWRLLTRMRVAPPVSCNAFTKVGADVWMLTANGVVSVLQSLRDARLALVDTISRPVRNEITKLIATGGEWDMHTSADGGMIILSHMKDGEGRQFTFHTEAKAWATSRLPALLWHSLGVETSFTATDGRLGVVQPEGVGDETITAEWRTSWFSLPRAASIGYLKPTIIAEGPLDVELTVLADRNETAADIAEAVQIVRVEPEGTAGVEEMVTLDERFGCDAEGEAFQIRLKVTARYAEIVGLKAALL